MKSTLAPKAHVQSIFSCAVLDFYEHLRGQGKSCWFIREGVLDPAISEICETPRAAWKSASIELKRRALREAMPSMNALASTKEGR